MDDLVPSIGCCAALVAIPVIFMINRALLLRLEMSRERELALHRILESSDEGEYNNRMAAYQFVMARQMEWVTGAGVWKALRGYRPALDRDQLQAMDMADMTGGDDGSEHG